MNIGKLLGALVRVVKANPGLVISAVTAVAPVVKEVKAAVKKRPTA